MERFYKGIPVSGRVAVGNAVVFLRSNIFIPRYIINKTSTSIDKEIEKLENALHKTKEELQKLKNEIKKTHTTFETGYLDTSILLLDDPMLKEMVLEKLKENYLNIEWTFNEVIEELAENLSQSNNVYFRERAPDVISIGQKVLKNLMGSKEIAFPKYIKDPIVIAHTISPPEFVSFFKIGVKAVVTEIGGKTSHVAIMARDLKIPAVVGVKDITKYVKTGEKVIVDGSIGTVLVDPSEDVLSFYVKKELKQRKFEKEVVKREKAKCRLKTGEEVTLLANLDIEEELEMIKERAFEGIGLFRTEYIFLNRENQPDEEEQYNIYRKLVEKTYPNEVTIRTIDIGGDKKPEYMEFPDEKNPFLGWRGIRFALSNKLLFKSQLRAILRASKHGKLRIMFPMINDIDEIKEIIALLDESKHELKKNNLEYDNNIPIGIMVETPSSVILLDIIAEYIDFISVGTNDLIQYTLAIDRGNLLVASDFDPVHPAMLRTLRTISDKAEEHNLDMSICGEMAGDPLYVLLLLGLGYRKLSMAIINIPIVYDIICNSTLEDAENLTNTLLNMNSKSEIHKYLIEYMTSRFKEFEDYFKHDI